MSLLDGLKLYFMLDETSGSCASSYGTSLTGSCSNITYSETGKVGNCYTFDRNNSYVDFDEINFTNYFTISLWVKTSYTTSNWISLFRHSSFVSYFQGVNLWAHGSDGLFECHLGDGLGTETYIYSKTPVNDGLWHLITASFDGIYFKIYFDGIVDNYYEITSTPMTIGYNSGRQIIGSDAGASWDGQIDEVAIWDRSLTQEEITEVYNKGLAGKNIYENLFNGLTAYYKLDELSGQIKDSSGKGHHTNLLSGVTLGVDGKINKCATFAAGNTAEVSNHSDFSFEQDSFSICAWCKINNFDDYLKDNVIFAHKSWWDGQLGVGFAPYSFEISWGYTQIRYSSGQTSSTQIGDPNQHIVTGEWHHFAVTYYSPHSMNFYYDGQLSASNTGTYNLVTGSTNLYIGSVGYGVSDTSLSGEIDELLIYNRPLFPSEIEHIYNLGLSGQTLIKDKTKYVSGKNSGPGEISSFTNLSSDNLINWKKFQILMKKSVDAGSIFENPIISTYPLAYTGDTAYIGCVLSPNGDIHFIPYNASVGQKVNCYTGVVSTYSLIHTVGGYLYTGGVLAPNGDIHFCSEGGGYTGQKVDINGIVSTYSLLTNGIFSGGVVDNNDDIHLVPGWTSIGQKIDINGNVSTYSLVYTTSYAYAGGVLAPNGDIHFIPSNAIVGQKVSPSGVVSTYSLAYTTASAYLGGVLSLNGDIHFIPMLAEVGQKIDINGAVSTYSLVYTQSYGFNSGVLAPNGDIHFIPRNATMGQKIDKNGVVSTYNIPSQLYCRGGVLAPTGDIYLCHAGNSYGIKISTTSTKPFSTAVCCSPYFNKF